MENKITQTKIKKAKKILTNQHPVVKEWQNASSWRMSIVNNADRNQKSLHVHAGNLDQKVADLGRRMCELAGLI